MIFLSESFFPYFFHVHLNILDEVVSSLYAIFGTPCIHTYIVISFKFKRKSVIRFMRNFFHVSVICQFSLRVAWPPFVLCVGLQLLRCEGHWRSFPDYENPKGRIMNIRMQRINYFAAMNFKHQKRHKKLQLTNNLPQLMVVKGVPLQLSKNKKFLI
jgi:hypothetical protein